LTSSPFHYRLLSSSSPSFSSPAHSWCLCESLVVHAVDSLLGRFAALLDTLHRPTAASSSLLFFSPPSSIAPPSYPPESLFPLLDSSPLSIPPSARHLYPRDSLQRLRSLADSSPIRSSAVLTRIFVGDRSGAQGLLRN
ncbi:hypothetical protein PFISCL1PPCAC_19893, partial [Pristionchus fissidentatus]